MQENSKQNYLHGAAIMAAGVVVTKILGAIYKIPLGNILGDEGYGYFSVAYNIYYVFLTMATAGMPVALSRMISEADTLGRPMQARKIFRVAWLTFAIFGILLGLVMFLFPAELAGMLNNVRAAQSIWALSPALVLVYLTSTYRGYAQGMSNMKPTTVSQILEVRGQGRVGLVLAWSFTRAGKGLPVASAGAIFGVTAGGAFALIYVSIYKHRHYPDKPVADPGRSGLCRPYSRHAAAHQYPDRARLKRFEHHQPRRHQAHHVPAADGAGLFGDIRKHSLRRLRENADTL